MTARIKALACALALCGAAIAQPARSVLDKVAAVVGNATGAEATFSLVSEQWGNAAGTIAVKGNKFCTDITTAKVWFDGKTQWTLLKRSNEVNINTPTEAELQAMNPYNFISIYREGYELTLQSNAASHVVTLKATDSSRQIQEMVVTADKQTYVPTHIRVRQGARWTDISISNFKQANLSDDTFRFDSTAYPTAEVIDLR